MGAYWQNQGRSRKIVNQFNVKNIFGKGDWMSIISVVYLPEGIVLAADSRLTGRKEYKDKDGNNVIEKYTLSDNAQKVVLLNKCKVGIASCGTAYIDGKTIADYIRLFEINDVDEHDTPESVADKLLIHGKEFSGTN